VVGFAAVALRLLGLADRPLHFSEALNVLIATLGVAEIPRAALASANSPPAYHLLLSLWRLVFGDSDFAVRSLSVAIGAASIAGTYALARRLMSPGVAYLSAGIAAVSAYGVASAQQATPHVLLGALALCSWVSLVLATDGDRRRWVSYVPVTVATLYTGDLGVLVLLTQWGYVVFQRRRLPESPIYLLCQIVIVLAYLPWVFMSPRGLMQLWQWFQRPSDIVGAALRVMAMFAFGSPGFAAPGPFDNAPLKPSSEAVMLAPVLLLAALGTAAVSSDRRAQIVLFLWPVTALLGLMTRPVSRDPFSLSFLVPGFAILLAAGIKSLATLAPPEARRVVAAGLVLWLVLLNLPSLVRLGTMASWDGLDWRTVAGAVAGEAAPFDVVVLVPGVYALPFARYFHGPQERLGFDPPGNGAGSSGGQDLPWRLWARQRRAVWVVRSDYLPGYARRAIEDALGRTHKRAQVRHYERLVVTRYAPHP